MALLPLDVLLVDDDEIDRESVLRLLDATYIVREASTAAQAQLMTVQKRPDCVLLDYRLPDIDGLQLLPTFTRAYIPVVILTGEESPEVVVQAMQVGAQDYLVKDRLTGIGLEHAITSAVERVALRRDIEEKNRQVRELASALALAEQRERRRISQILHDHVQQILYGIQMRAQMVEMDAPANADIRDHVAALQSLIEEAIDTTRTLTVELSPPVLHDEGLAATLQWLASHMAERHNLQVDLDIRADYMGPNEDVRMLLFQLVRELLFNVVKHAGVMQARLILTEEEDTVVIQVIDTGQGFDIQRLALNGERRNGFGLYSVRERIALLGGQLEVETHPGAGVCATIVLPRQLVLPL
jgi:signal transduction histidine kinase